MMRLPIRSRFWKMARGLQTSDRVSQNARSHGDRLLHLRSFFAISAIPLAFQTPDSRLLFPDSIRPDWETRKLEKAQPFLSTICVRLGSLLSTYPLRRMPALAAVWRSPTGRTKLWEHAKAREQSGRVTTVHRAGSARCISRLAGPDCSAPERGLYGG